MFASRLIYKLFQKSAGVDVNKKDEKFDLKNISFGDEVLLLVILSVFDLSIIKNLYIRRNMFFTANSI